MAMSVRVYEDGVEDGVEDKSGHLDDHRRPRIPLGGEDAVYGIGGKHKKNREQDGLHIAHRQHADVRGGTEERIEKIERQAPQEIDNEGEKHSHDYAVGSRVLRRFPVLSAEEPRDDRVYPDAQAGIQADHDKEDGEGEGQGGDRCGPQPADEGGVHDVVHCLDEHGYGDGRGHDKERPPGVGDKLVYSVFHGGEKSRGIYNTKPPKKQTFVDVFSRFC